MELMTCTQNTAVFGKSTKIKVTKSGILNRPKIGKCEKVIIMKETTCPETKRHSTQTVETTSPTNVAPTMPAPKNANGRPQIISAKTQTISGNSSSIIISILSARSQTIFLAAIISAHFRIVRISETLTHRNRNFQITQNDLSTLTTPL